MKEEWKDIKGYEGKFQVSNLGRVRRISHYNTNKNGIKIHVSERICTVSTNKHTKYLSVGLYGKTYLVHRLVAEAFLENPNNLPIVDHKDRNRSNPELSNLRWVTNKGNSDNSSKKTKGLELVPNFNYPEVWVDLGEFDKNLTGYKFSSWGRYIGKKSNEILNPKLNKNEKYPQINPKGKRVRVHQALATLFIDNPNNYSCVLHLDDNAKNFSLDNLRWGTLSNNMKDVWKNSPSRSNLQVPYEKCLEICNLFLKHKTIAEVVRITSYDKWVIGEIIYGRYENFQDKKILNKIKKLKTFIESEKYKNSVERLINECKEDVLKLLSEDYTLDEIVEEVGTTKSSLDRFITIIKDEIVRPEIPKYRNSSLDKETVLNIVDDIKKGLSQRKVAEKYKTSRAIVDTIVHGRCYSVWTGFNDENNLVGKKPHPIKDSITGKTFETATNALEFLGYGSIDMLWKHIRGLRKGYVMTDGKYSRIILNN